MESRKCAICGNEFQPHNPRQKVCDTDHYHPCPNCGVAVLSNKINEQNKCCSRKCGQAIGNISRKKTNLSKYGVDNVAKLEHVFTKICKYCGAEFQTNSPRQIYCGNDYYNCPVCGKRVKIRDMQQVGAACSTECRLKKTAETNMERYGVDVIFKSDYCKEKSKETNLEKYGVEYYSQTDEFKVKFKDTSLEHFGTEHPLQNDNVKAKQIATNNERYGGNAPTSSPLVRAKVKNTVDERHGGYTWQSAKLSAKASETVRDIYGVDNVMQNPKVQEKARKTNLEKYGAPTFMQSLHGYEISISDPKKADEYKEFVSDPKAYIETNYVSTPTIYVLCKDLGVTDTPIYMHLIKNNCRDLISFKTSTMEYEILRFIEDLLPDATIIRNDRSAIKPLEIDIYLPEYNFGVECNPTITHNSSIADPWGGEPKSPSYHKNKSKKALEHNIQLFHVFGYEWSTKQDIIKSMISNCLGVTTTKIYGRNTKIVELDYTTATKFLNDNHRQGATSAKIFLGLIYKDELVSVMSFNHMRPTIGKVNAEPCWELSRFCNKLDTTVVGGASKLFKHFVKTYEPNKIVSFSDIAHTTGNLYKVLEFKETNISEPGYVWVSLKDDSYYNRVTCQKKNLRKLFNDETIDVDHKTERQIMLEHGYVQVFDSGIIRWEWK